MPDSKCHVGGEGCLTMEDCHYGYYATFKQIHSNIALSCSPAGLECDRTASRPKCVDIDECTGGAEEGNLTKAPACPDSRVWAATGQDYCGHNTSCANVVC